MFEVVRCNVSVFKSDSLEACWAFICQNLEKGIDFMQFSLKSHYAANAASEINLNIRFL